MLATDKSLTQLPVNENSNKPTEQTDIFKMVSLSFNKNESHDLAISCSGGGCAGCGGGNYSPETETEHIFHIISFTSANLQADNLLRDQNCQGGCGGCSQCNL